jgi:hypothetical protein
MFGELRHRTSGKAGGLVFAGTQAIRFQIAEYLSSSGLTTFSYQT